METSSTGLTAFDLGLADCVEAGEVFSFSRFAEQHPGEASDDLSEEHLTLHSDIIRRLLTGEPLPGETRARVLTEAGLRIVGLGSGQPTAQTKKKRRSLRDYIERLTEQVIEPGNEPLGEELDLSGISTKVPIELIDCDLVGGLNLENANLRSLNLNNSRLKHFHARDMKVLGTLHAIQVKCDTVFDIRNAFIDGDVKLQGSKLGEDLSGDNNNAALHAGSATILGDLLITNAQLKGRARMKGIQISRNLEFNNTKVSCVAPTALNIVSATIEGDVNLTGTSLVSVGKFTLNSRDAAIGGNFWMDGEFSSGPNQSNVFSPFETSGSVLIEDAVIERNLVVSGAILNQDGRNDFSILGARIKVGGELFFNVANSEDNFDVSPFIAYGPIDLRLSSVKDKIRLHGAQLLPVSRERSSNKISGTWRKGWLRLTTFFRRKDRTIHTQEGETWLDLNSATCRVLQIKGYPEHSPIDLPARIAGPLSIQDVTIEEDLDLVDCIIGDGENAVLATDATIRGNVSIATRHPAAAKSRCDKPHCAYEGTVMYGTTRFNRANIGSDLEVKGVTLKTSPNAISFDAERLTVDSTVYFLSTPEHTLRIHGETYFRAATINGSFITLKEEAKSLRPLNSEFRGPSEPVRPEYYRQGGSG